MAMAAGMRRSSSAMPTGRTRGSGATAGGPSIAISGCRGRWSRHGPQYGASRSHSGATDDAGPTIVEHRRPARRGGGGDAPAAARPAAGGGGGEWGAPGGGTPTRPPPPARGGGARPATAPAPPRPARGAANGMRLPPASPTASSEPPPPMPHRGAPSTAGSVPAVSTRPAMTHAATGSRASRRVTARSSASSRIRAVGVPSTSGDGDDRRARRGAVLRLLPRHVAGQSQRLLDERLDDLRLRNGLDDLALDEDLPLAVARRDAEVGLAGLARSVDDAAHDRDPQRDVHAFQPGGHLVGQRVDVDLRAPARRAADDLQAAL